MLNEIVSTLQPSEIPYSLPESWTWYRWRDLIVKYQQGLIRSNAQLGSGNVRYLKMGDLDGNGTCNLNNLVSAEATRSEIGEFGLSKGDFLINVRNSFELVGKSCIVGEINNETILFNHMLVRIRHKHDVSNYFINAFFNTPIGRKLIKRCRQGTTTVIALYQRNLYEIPVPLPDFETQESISSIYKKILGKIDLNNHINRELEAMAKLIYDYWFVQFDFPMSKEQAEALGKPELVGKPYKASGGPMVWNAKLKKEIPVGWEVKKLSSLCQNISRGISPSYIEARGICVLNQKCIRDKSINFSLARRHDDSIKKADAKLIQLWDVLVNSTGVGTLGRVALVKRLPERRITVDSHVTIVRSNSTLVKKLYLGYALSERQKEIESFSQGSTGQVELSKDQLGSLIMTIPSDQLQKSFCQFLEPILLKKATNEKENEHLASLRDWLLPMLMNGQVRVHAPAAYKFEEEEVRMVAEPEVRYKKS